MNKETFYAYLVSGGFAAFGGLANYFYNQSKHGKPFNAGMFLANLFVAFFVGVFMGALLSEDLPQRDGVILAGGYSAMKVLELLEVAGPKIISRFLPK